MTEYFTRKETIPDYGWSITVYDPTVAELENFQKLSLGTVKWEEVDRILLSLIKEWGCTDRAGNVLPVTPEGMAQIPAAAKLSIASIIFTPKRLDSKNASSSLPTSQQGNEGQPKS